MSDPRGKRYFEFMDGGTSSKFWEVELDGLSVKTRYGRIGSAGQSAEKAFDSAEKAEKEYDKLVREKTGKGYVEGKIDPGTVAKVVTTGLWKSGVKIACEYDDQQSWPEKLQDFLAKPGAAKTEELIVGPWWHDDSAWGSNVNAVRMVEALASAEDQLPNLRRLYVGDIESEESEVSWIEHTDLSPLLLAFPDLEHLKVKGANGLSLGNIGLPRLRSLELYNGGLNVSVVQEIINSSLPALEHLEIYLGQEDYGASATPDDLRPLLEAGRFPRLGYLGLKNAEITDGICELLPGAPVLGQIHTLDLSEGTLSDKGAEALMQVEDWGAVKTLHLDHHFMTDKGMKAVKEHFKALNIRVTASEQQDPYEWDEDEAHYFTAVGE